MVIEKTSDNVDVRSEAEGSPERAAFGTGTDRERDIGGRKEVGEEGGGDGLGFNKKRTSSLAVVMVNGA